MKTQPLEVRAIAALVRYERAAAELTRIKKGIVSTLEECPITIEAYTEHGYSAMESGTSVLWDGTRVNHHLHQALTSKGWDGSGLDDQEISDQLTGWDDDDNDPLSCPHCLAAWNLIQDRKQARQEFGQAKRLIRALAKSAIRATEQCQFPQSCPMTCGCSSKGTSS